MGFNSGFKGLNIIRRLSALLFRVWNEEDQMGEMSSMRLEESKIKQISLSNLRRNEERYEKQMQQGYNIKMHILKEGYTIPYSFHTDSRIVVVLARRQFDWYLKAEMLHRCMQ